MKNTKKSKIIEELKDREIHKLEDAIDISKKFASKNLMNLWTYQLY